MLFNDHWRGRVLDWFGSRQGQELSSCQRGNERSVSIKWGNIWLAKQLLASQLVRCLTELLYLFLFVYLFVCFVFVNYYRNLINTLFPPCMLNTRLVGKNSSSSPSSFSSSSYIFHGVGPLVDPFRSHVSRSLFKGQRTHWVITHAYDYVIVYTQCDP